MLFMPLVLTLPSCLFARVLSPPAEEPSAPFADLLPTFGRPNASAAISSASERAAHLLPVPVVPAVEAATADETA
eukprot:CAMPEP_0171874232 /NCGR_PEP_ID=MMETSP0992-20121227/34852_1 /TAXON_ID=483369 /ORGANISM="non described non described, Strain CCMP2098" /LENGTH=74 /DNA_ID=CAMNT_0012498999 /DNA_START=43 /DNA_END=264 /DNA_ORIENTATION=-